MNCAIREIFVLVRLWERRGHGRSKFEIKINGAASGKNLKLRHRSFKGAVWSRRCDVWC